MRTKLDEIVEEEGRRWVELMRPAPWTGEQVVVAERIAELAFRHGVEQGLLAEWTATFLKGLAITGPKVRPAPAEEKGIRSAAEARTEGWGVREWVKEARDLAGQIVYDDDTKKCLLVLAANLEDRRKP